MTGHDAGPGTGRQDQVQGGRTRYREAGPGTGGQGQVQEGRARYRRARPGTGRHGQVQGGMAQYSMAQYTMARYTPPCTTLGTPARAAPWSYRGLAAAVRCAGGCHAVVAIDVYWIPIYHLPVTD